MYVWQRVVGLTNRETIRCFEYYSLQLAVHNGSGTHVWTRSPVIPLTDWVQNNQRSSEWMEQLAKQLNSAEDIDVTEGVLCGIEFFQTFRTRRYQPW